MQRRKQSAFSAKEWRSSLGGYNDKKKTSLYQSEADAESRYDGTSRHEVGKEGGNIMGGDWLKVISTRRGATCSVEVIQQLRDSQLSVPQREEKIEFCTDSTFAGQVDALTMHGECTYTMPHDVVFEGSMHEARCHGVGTLSYPNSGRIDGTFEHGKLTPMTYTFNDGLVYEVPDWKYCTDGDRRFQMEIKYGLNPVCTALKTQLQPTRTIPEGCYDTGDGFFNPKTMCVTSPDTGHIIRVPTRKEAKWIIKHCRKAWDEGSGYRPAFYESFKHDDINYAPLLMEHRRRTASLATYQEEM